MRPLLFMLLMLPCFLALPWQAQAEDAELAPLEVLPADMPESVRILVVDIDAIIREAVAAESVMEQLQKLRSSYQREAAAEEAALQQMQEDLERDRLIISEGEYRERQEKFNERLVTVQRQIQERRNALDEGYHRSNDILRRAAIQIAAEYMQEASADLVVSNRMIVLSNAALDISEQVLTTLDKRLPKMEITITEDEAAASGQGR